MSGKTFSATGALLLLSAWLAGLWAPRGIAAEQPGTTVCLKSSMQPSSQAHAVTTYLEREFARQAVLMAARDLGCATRDMALREPFPAETPEGTAVLDIEAHPACSPASRCQCYFVREGRRTRRVVVASCK